MMAHECVTEEEAGTSCLVDVLDHPGRMPHVLLDQIPQQIHPSRVEAAAQADDPIGAEGFQGLRGK
jgi:hypothetical protein